MRSIKETGLAWSDDRRRLGELWTRAPLVGGRPRHWQEANEKRHSFAALLQPFVGTLQCYGHEANFVCKKWTAVALNTQHQTAVRKDQRFIVVAAQGDCRGGFIGRVV